MDYKWVSVYVLFFSVPFCFAQTGITGEADIYLVNEGVDCDGAGRIVSVFVDVTGLTGLSGDVGLNSFILSIDFNRSHVFASAIPGTDPTSGWGFVHTDRSMVHIINQVTLVGWVADINAPNSAYHVATLLLAGTSGEVILTVNGQSSLGSRVIGSDGPGVIPVATPLASLSVIIPQDFTLMILPALPFWMNYDAQFDLVSDGLINVQDFIKIIFCGGS